MKVMNFFKKAALAVVRLVALLFVVIALLYFHDRYFPWTDRKIEREFVSRLEEAVAISDSNIPLKNLTSFEWDRVCYFTEQNVEGAPVPSPSEVWGREYHGYIPDEMCDTLQHRDLFFTSEDTAYFVQLPTCNVYVGCPVEEFSSGELRCCSKSAYVTGSKTGVAFGEIEGK